MQRPRDGREGPHAGSGGLRRGVKKPRQPGGALADRAGVPEEAQVGREALAGLEVLGSREAEVQREADVGEVSGEPPVPRRLVGAEPLGLELRRETGVPAQVAGAERLLVRFVLAADLSDGAQQLEPELAQRGQHPEAHPAVLLPRR